MAIYYARATGNVNGTIWATTPTGTASNLFSSFTNADTLMSNNFTVTLNVNTTVLEIRNDTTGGATAGGSFTLSDGVTLTANVINGSTTLTLTYNGNVSATMVGSIQSNNGTAVSFGGTGTFNIIGNIQAGSFSGGHGILCTGNGTVNITGNVNGSPGNTASGVYATTTTGVVNITGTVTGGGIGSAPGARNSSTGTLNIFGIAIGGIVATGVNNESTGIVYVLRAKGNGFGNGSVGIASVVGVSANQNGSTRVSEIEYGDLGQSPTSGPIILTNSTSNVALFYRSGTTKKTLVDPANSSGLFPNASDVRNGISYNAGNIIGTMNVPAAANVALNVGVDNTTGTAVLNVSDIWNYSVSGISVSDSIGERLKNCSTVATMGTQLVTAINNI
ncbi:MAG: hypothetical protein EBS98_01990 [Chitinophagia bacterium]|nr:hypothetical protein [Chitinophagia bacterium]